MMLWLIAEDDADIRSLIAIMCQVWGHETLVFENGEAVWKWLDVVEKSDYDGKIPQLILMDIRMPGKKGNELAQRMRSISSLTSVPIVLMTAFALTESERQEMMSAGGVDHILLKPLPDFEELRTLLHTIVEGKQMV